MTDATTGSYGGHGGWQLTQALGVGGGGALPGGGGIVDSEEGGRLSHHQRGKGSVQRRGDRRERDLCWDLQMESMVGMGAGRWVLSLELNCVS